MPELPEVETVARQLRPLTAGLQVKGLVVLDQLLGSPPVSTLPGRTLAMVSRLGKFVIFELTHPQKETLWLAVHLRMTGRLIWSPGAPSGPARHLRARLLLSGGEVCFFDPRRFGTLQILSSLQGVQPAGLDPTTSAFTVQALTGLLGRGKQELKAWLLRQDKLVGLGNIYASEILFEARIDPRREAGSLTRAEIRRLHQSTCEVLGRAIQNCGTTFSDFQGARGKIGGYQKYLKVYKREGEACVQCGGAIARLSQQGRSTFFCGRCQRNPRRLVG